MEGKALASDYINFGSGAALGAAVELSINMSNECVSTLANTFMSVYLMTYYMKQYMTTNEDEYVAYGVQYSIKFMRLGQKMNTCNSYFGALNGPQYKSPFLRNMPSSLEKVVSASQNKDAADLISQFINIVGDFEEVLGVFEIFINTRTVYDEWYSGDYFESGLFAGKAMVSSYFTGYNIIKKYYAM